MGGQYPAGNVLKETGTTHWKTPSVGTDAKGFNALPGGYREPNGSFANSLGYYGFWWTTTKQSSGIFMDRWLYYSSGTCYDYETGSKWFFYPLHKGLDDLEYKINST